MAKHKKRLKSLTLKTAPKIEQQQKQVDLARGTINHSAMAALVTSKIFCMKVEKAKKGKGSYNRKAKHSGKECYQIAA
jgi:alternative ribosome-rescue factor